MIVAVTSCGIVGIESDVSDDGYNESVETMAGV